MVQRRVATKARAPRAAQPVLQLHVLETLVRNRVERRRRSQVQELEPEQARTMVQTVELLETTGGSFHFPFIHKSKVPEV
jgi:hypothetical protein